MSTTSTISIVSQKSGSSTRSKHPRYKLVKRTDSVDESLFGSSHTVTGVRGSTKVMPKKRQQGIGSITGPNGTSTPKEKATGRRLNREETQKLTHRGDAVIVSKDILKRVKGIAKMDDEVTEHARIQNEIRQKRAEAAQLRRERIRQIDNEKKLCGEKRMTDLEEEDAEKERETIERSITFRDEEMDDVKHMNSLILHSQAATIRDKQLEEKKLLEQMRKEEEKRLDDMMEMERYKALKMYEEREKLRNEDRRRGAAMVLDQMKEREKERIRQLEMKDEEQRAMLEHIERMKEEEQRELERKKEVTQQMMEEAALANAEQIRLKRRLKHEERQEELQIAAYLAEKDRMEQEHMEEQERIKAEKEREVARLRAKQERVTDKQAELDALRAKRIQEEKEREWRRTTREEMARKKQMNDELNHVHRRQIREKESQLAYLAGVEREMFERVTEHQKEEEEIEKMKEAEEKRRVRENAEGVKQQIETRKALEGRQRQEYLLEGRQMMEKEEAERKKMDFIRRKKLKELEQTGIPEKYRTELAGKKFQEALRPAMGNRK